MTAAEKHMSRNLVTLGLSSSEIDGIRAAFKDRAFFSARCQSVRHLQTAQGKIADWISSAKTERGTFATRADAVQAIMDSARREGIATGTGKLSDPGSEARAKVIVDTNAGLAAGYVDWLDANSEGARRAFPAFELIRVTEPGKPENRRDWFARWREAGGITYQGRMIALKEDDIWVSLSRFGVPYPPFDYNSGMGVDDVPFDECVALGLITDDWNPKADAVENFNATLEAQMDFEGEDDPYYQFMKDAFGDQIKYDGGKVKWQADIIQDMIANPATAPTATRLGKPTAQCLRVAKESNITLPNSQLTMTRSNIEHARKRHIGTAETHADGIPLIERDLELIPHVWRFPDRVYANGGVTFIDMDSVDGSIYRIVVKHYEKDINFSTFYHTQ